MSDDLHAVSGTRSHARPPGRSRVVPRLVVAIVVAVLLVPASVLLATLVAPRLAASVGAGPARTASAEAASLAHLVRIWLADRGSTRVPPDLTLDRLADGAEPLLRADDLIDPWGHAYRIVVHDDGSFDVVSHGADGRPGGSGAAADIVHAAPPAA